MRVRRSKNRWFDLDAVRGPSVEPHTMKVGEASVSRGIAGGDSGNPEKDRLSANPAGAPPHDMWNIATSPYKGSHYATYPIELCRIPILSMCPLEVCDTCNDPRRRITERTPEYAAIRDAVGDFNQRAHGQGIGGNRSSQMGTITSAQNVTVGWSECTCESPRYRPGVVLDPFAGSGTTLAAALGHGRSAIGIDLDERNADLARQRVGMFLEIDTPTQESAA